MTKKNINIQIARPLAIATLLIWAGTTYGASFDCNRASTNVELAICNDPELSEADSILATTYRQALANNPAAKERQLAWLQQVRNRCQDKNCLLQSYRQQTTALTINFVTPTMPAAPSPVESTYATPSRNHDAVQLDQPSVRYVPTEPAPPQKIEPTPATQEQVKGTKATPVSAAQGATNSSGESAKEESGNLTMMYVVLAAIAMFFIWNKFIRLRCPECKSAKVNTIGVDEVDRWRGNKKVTETNSRGSKTRYISTTYVKKQYHFQCAECHSQWADTRKEEL